MLHHTEGERCLLCEEKLKSANPVMVSWFYWIKAAHPQVHIAWAFRNKADQDHFLQMKLTRAPWPTSKHNKCDALGNPCAEALDLFRIINNEAVFSNADGFYLQLYRESQQAQLPIEWAGTWQTFKEMDHFQFKGAS